MEYTTDEVAELLNIKPRAVRMHIERGNIAATKRGRDLFITQAALDTFKSNRKGPGRPKKESTS
jgi:excisionase family DNA binding protein